MFQSSLSFGVAARFGTNMFFHISMLRKYISDSSHVLEAPFVELKKDLSFKVQPMGIVDQRMKELWNKVILMVKDLWNSDTVKEVIWETKAYLYLFSN